MYPFAGLWGMFDEELGVRTSERVLRSESANDGISEPSRGGGCNRINFVCTYQQNMAPVRSQDERTSAGIPLLSYITPSLCQSATSMSFNE